MTIDLRNNVIRTKGTTVDAQKDNIANLISEFSFIYEAIGP